MKKILLLIIISTLFNFCFGQPVIEWQKCLGGTGMENGSFIAQTKDGGFVVGGSSRSNDGDVTGHHGGIDTSDYWIVKLDSNSNIEWQKSLGGSDFDIANSIVQAPDGGYVIAGYSDSQDGDVTGNHGYSDYWIVKLDSSGNIVWEKSLGGMYNDEAYSIILTRDSGYIVAGFSNSNDGDVSGNHGSDDYWVVKIDGVGNILWQRCYGGGGLEIAHAIIQTSDGGYAIAGYSSGYWIIKIDSIGNIEWQKTLGGTLQDYAFSIVQSTDGGFAVAGWSASNDGDITQHHGSTDYADYWIVKLDTSGNLQWEKSLGGTADDMAYSIIATVDSGFIVAGFTSSTNGDVSGYHGIWDYWLTKLDSIGNLIWQKPYGGTGSEFCYSIISTSDGGYAAMGLSASNDIDVSGNHSGGNHDYWVVKFLSDSLTTNLAQSQIKNPPSEILLTPNPTTSLLKIQTTQSIEHIELYSVLGKQVGSWQFSSRSTAGGKKEIEIDLTKLSAGIYFLQASSGEKVWRGKVVKE